MKSREIISAIFQIALIITTVILCTLSLLLSKEVWEKYTLKATSFSKSDVPISPADTVAVLFGFWPLKNMNYSKEVPYQSYEQLEIGKDFNVTYGLIDYRTIIESVDLTESGTSQEMKHNQMSEVKFEKLTTRFGYYYRIKSDVTQVRPPHLAFFQLHINQNIPDENLPNIEVILQSEVSSYGVTMWDWKDGDRVSEAKLRGYNVLRVKPHQVNDLKLSGCQEKPYYQCFEEKLLAQDFSNCPRKCSSVTSFNNLMPLCETLEEFSCAHEKAKEIQVNNSDCKKPCSKTNFLVHKSNYNEEATDGKRNIIFTYEMPVQEMIVEQKYLIYDFGSMLGSIGGTLGMFIGFSFLGSFSTLMGWLQRLVEYFDERKVLTKATRIVKVKEADKNPQNYDNFGSDFSGQYVKRSELFDQVKYLEDKIDKVAQS